MSMTAKIEHYVPGFRKTAGLVKREILDQKTGFITVPLVVAGLVVLATLGNLVFGADQISQITDFIREGGLDGADFNGQNFNEFISEIDPSIIKTLIGGAALALAMPLLMILPFVMVNALLSTLFDDRKDRSYLFFKSMPVSDTHEVAAKVGAILVGAPLITLAIAFVLQIVVAVGLSLYLMPTGIPVGMMWLNMPVISTWGPLFVMMLAYMLWALPFIGWGLAVSAYAPKAPLMFAVVPLVAVSIIEQVVLETGYFAKWLLSYAGVHFGQTAVDVFKDKKEIIIQDMQDAKINMITASDSFQVISHSLTQADFWIGIAIGTSLIAIAIRGRKYNL